MALHDLTFSLLVGNGVPASDTDNVQNVIVEIAPAYLVQRQDDTVNWAVVRKYKTDQATLTIEGLEDTDADGNDVVWQTRVTFMDRASYVGGQPDKTWKFPAGAPSSVAYPSGVTYADPDVNPEYGPTWAEQAKVARDEAVDAAASVQRNEPGGVAGLTTSGTLYESQIPTRLTPGGLTATYGPAVSVENAQRWSTLPNATEAFQQSASAPFAPMDEVGSKPVFVDARERFQSMVGFGAALTDSAAYNLAYRMTAEQRHELLDELFNPDRCNWSMIRLPLGASDFTSKGFYTYDDVLVGNFDTTLANFSLKPDFDTVIPILREIMAINPGVRILASPWSPPAWMKQGTAPVLEGGSLNNLYYAAYAQYFVKFIKAYQALGIPIWAVTPQNEPSNTTTGRIGMNFLPAEQALFIGQHLGPALRAAGLSTKIIIHDDGWGPINSTLDVPSVLADDTANTYIDGVGWHGYGGDPAQQLIATAKWPNKSHYFTEMRTLLAQDWAASAKIMAGDLAVSTVRYGSRAIMLWNLALDQTGNPQQGSPGRRGVITIQNDGSGATSRWVEYYMLTHLAKHMQPGAQRIRSTTYALGNGGTDLETVAFVNPDESLILFCYNPTGSDVKTQIVDIRTGEAFPAVIRAGEMCHFVWGIAPFNTPAGAPVVYAKPGAPTLTATGTSGRVQLSINPGSSGDLPVSAYRIERSTDGTIWTKVAELPAGDTTFADALATVGTTYMYRAKAMSAAGASPASATVTATATAKTAPAQVAATGESGNNLSLLRWTAPDNGGSPITGYRIKRATSGGSLTTLATVGAGIGFYRDTTVVSGTAYDYTVEAINAVGTGPASTIATVTPTVAAAVSTTSAGTATNTKTCTVSHTVAATDKLLIVAVTYSLSDAPNASALASVTYGGVAMSKLSAAQDSSTADSSAVAVVQRGVELWYLVNPTAGTANVVATLGTTNVGAIAVTAVNLYNTSGAFGTVARAATRGAFSVTAQATSPNSSLILVHAAANATAALTGSPELTQLRSQIAGSSAAQYVGTVPGGESVSAKVTNTSGSNEVLTMIPILAP